MERTWKWEGSVLDIVLEKWSWEKIGESMIKIDLDRYEIVKEK